MTAIHKAPAKTGEGRGLATLIYRLTLWERACSRRRHVSQHHRQL